VDLVGGYTCSPILGFQATINVTLLNYHGLTGSASLDILDGSVTSNILALSYVDPSGLLSFSGTFPFNTSCAAPVIALGNASISSGLQGPNTTISFQAGLSFDRCATQPGDIVVVVNGVPQGSSAPWVVAGYNTTLSQIEMTATVPRPISPIFMLILMITQLYTDL